METQVAPDRRAAHKARHRQAILDAADALIHERGKPQFSVDELAERADVARRTIFNHFASLDDVIMSACTRVVAKAVEEFQAATASTPTVNHSLTSLFIEMTTALRGIDLPPVIAYVWRVLGEEGDHGRSSPVLQDVFARTTEQVAVEAVHRHAELGELEVTLMVSSALNGIAVIAEHWVKLTGAALDAPSRAVWTDLLDRLILIMSTGYAPQT